MSKEDIISIFVYLGMLAIAIIVGYTVLYPSTGLNTIGYVSANNGASFLFILIFVLVGVILNGIFLELGHVLGALIGGYSVISCNIFGFCLAKHMENDKAKWKFKAFQSFDGLTGETKVAPKKEKTAPMAGVLLPFIFLVLEAAALYLVLTLIDKKAGDILLTVKFGVVIVATIGLMFTLYNYIPLHIDSTTDGYRIVLFSKKVNVEAYNKFLTYNAADILKIEKPKLEIINEITDYTAQFNMLSVYEWINNNELDKARAELDRIISEKKKLSKSALYLYTTQKIYVDMLKKDGAFDEEFKKSFRSLDSEIRSYIYKAKSLEAFKVYLLVASKIENSKSETAQTIENFKKAYKKSTDLTKDIEKSLFEKTVELISNK